MKDVELVMEQNGVACSAFALVEIRIMCRLSGPPKRVVSSMLKWFQLGVGWAGVGWAGLGWAGPGRSEAQVLLVAALELLNACRPGGESQF